MLLRLVTISIFIIIFNSVLLLQKENTKRAKVKLHRLNTINKISPMINIPPDDCFQMIKDLKNGTEDKPFDYFSSAMNKAIKSQILLSTLKNLIVFKNIPTDIYEPLIPYLKLIFISKGEILYTQGDTTDGIYFLLHGRCAYMSRVQENTKHCVPIVFINPGDSIGDFDYETDLRIFTCKSFQDSYLLYIKSHVYEL
jgi:Cyclic nucleotide-binding domain